MSCNNNYPTRLSKIIVLLFTASLINMVTAQNAYAIGDQRVKQSRQLIEQGARLSFRKNDGKTRFIGTPTNKAIAIPGTGPHLSADQNARLIMNSMGTVFGIQDTKKQLRTMKQHRQKNGKTMVRYQQLHNGVPVLGGEVIVNMDSQQRLISMNGELSDDNGIINTTPTITPEQASHTGLATIAEVHKISPQLLKTSTPELKIYEPKLIGPQTGEATLVWHLEIKGTSPQYLIRELVLINAISGKLELHFNQVHTAKNRETYDSRGNEKVYDYLPGDRVCTEADGDICTDGINPDADKAHRFAGDVYDYFLKVHDRDSLDNKGGKIISSVNFCTSDPRFKCPLPNAFWDGEQMIYGQGYAEDDVVAHELTHAVTEHTSNLYYYHQSGAISESFSDMWGEFVDIDNGNNSPADAWLIGEELKDGAIRSMAFPTMFEQPDKMTSIFYATNTNKLQSDFDNGGVHTNSGINNKAVYLMADTNGVKPFNGYNITGIGTQKVAKIYYEAQTSLLTSGSDYSDLYAAVNQACSNLINNSEITEDDCITVNNALDAVEMNLDPNNINPDTEGLCMPGDSTGPSFAFIDDMEYGFGYWTFRNSIGGIHHWQSTFDVLRAPYATSGVHSLFVEAINSRSDQTAEIIVNVPNRRPYLHFKHYIELEKLNVKLEDDSIREYNDGAVVEYSIDNGATWIDASSLFVDGQPYNDYIPGSSPNTLSNRNVFTGISHGYVSSRYNLSSLQGQKVKFRWRVATDNSNYYNDDEDPYAWLIDDVAIYSCDNTAATKPTLLMPDNNAKFAKNDLIKFDWDDGTDADGDDITHTLLVCQGKGCLPIKPHVQTATAFQLTPALAGLGVGGILLLFITGSSQRRQAYVLVILVSSLLLTSSCGGGSSSRTISGPPLEYRWRVAADDGNSVTYSEIRNYSVAVN
ncbi:MAG: M4 family metallopeptidase [Gammaproteobacteria bacterium]|nr:M4 family metallopeptidase [Gammaproteobacteria bacterium]